MAPLACQTSQSVPPASLALQAAAQALSITGGTLVDPRGISTPDASIVIRNGRIACVGSRAACPTPAGARIIDATGKFITPGLIDAHVHYSQNGWVDARPDAIDLRAERAYDSTVAVLQRNPGPFDRACLCSGVTAVFDVGGFPTTISMARAHETDPLAPRMAAAGPLLTSRPHWLNPPLHAAVRTHDHRLGSPERCEQPGVSGRERNKGLVPPAS